MTEETTKIISNAPDPIDLNKKYRDAMEHKYQGMAYIDIAKEVDVSLNTIKSWFKTGGLLFDKYYIFAEEKIAALEKESKMLLRREIWNAVAVMNKALREYVSVKTTCKHCKKEVTVKVDLPTQHRVRAAVEVLDRVFGKSEQKISGEVQVNNYEHLTEEQLTERARDLIGKLGIEGKE